MQTKWHLGKSIEKFIFTDNVTLKINVFITPLVTVRLNPNNITTTTTPAIAISITINRYTLEHCL